ncbi:MAG: MAPEG family protein [Pacificimonas sp.]
MFDIALPLTALGIILALLAYIVAIRQVGKMRGKYGIKVPAMTGHEEFDRALRAQMNSLEFLPIFLTLAVILAGLYGDVIGGIYSAIYALGRWLYVRGYIVGPEKRIPGFMIATFSTLIALIASIGGLIWQLVS